MRFDQSKCRNSFTRIDGPAASPLGYTAGAGLPGGVRQRSSVGADARPRAPVPVLEQNFDVGGKLAHSGGRASLGGGDAKAAATAASDARAAG